MTVHISSASITSITTDSGSSSTDFYTNDQTLIVGGAVSTNGSGTAASLVVFAVSGSTEIYLGTATIAAGATTWALPTAGPSLTAGTYDIQIFAQTSHTYPFDGFGSLASHSVTIDTTAPTETIPGGQTDNWTASNPEGAGKLIFGSTHGNAITVADNNTDTLTVALSVTNGTFTLSGTTGLTFVSGSNGAGAMTISGTASAINNALANSTYHTTSTNTQTGNTDGVLSITTTDQAGNTSGAKTVNIDVICFMAGTMIRTPQGEIAVEKLKRGDLVLTNDNRSMPVTWLGRQTVSRLFADPLRVLPVRIRAGALGDNVPGRDLLISPDHAVLVDGALIQAGALINGTSIVRETNTQPIFTYYHVELDDHSLILAENTPAETFIDNIDRLNFDNWAEHQALYPAGKTIEELPYPRAKSLRQVPVAIRVRLADRAHAIGSASDIAAVA